MSEIIQPIKPKTPRIFELDFLRGVWIMGMLVTHLFEFSMHYLRIWTGGKTAEITTNSLWSWFMEYIYYVILITMGITLTFSRHNNRRAAILFGVYIVSVLLSFLIYYEASIRQGYPSNDTFFFNDHTMFFYYAFFIFIFQYIIRLPLQTQFIMFLILLVPSVLSVTGALTMPSINPLYYLGIDWHLNMPANTRETLMWPGIAFFSFGTLIGQIYYKDKISPFVTEKYSNAMQKNPFTRLLMWCGKNSLLSFVLQILFFLALEVIMAAVNFIS